MSVPTSLVGDACGSLTTLITPRLAMAYAASVGDHNPCYFDDTRTEPVIAHPILTLSLEMPLGEASSLNKIEDAGSVHATQDMIFHRPVQVGDVLTTSGQIVGIEQRPPGAYGVMRFDTTDSSGQLVVTGYFGMLFRGVLCDGPDRWLDRPPEFPSAVANGGPGWSVPISIPWGLPHVYSECAKAYHPIHSERAAAKRVGLPDIGLQGGATLAIAVRELVDRCCDGEPGRLARVSVRFAAWVVPGATITVRLDEHVRTEKGGMLRFTVLNKDGQPAIRDGVVLLKDT